MKTDYFTLVKLMKQAKTLEEFHHYAVLMVQSLKAKK